ncbi:MAG: GspH/FimT family protein [Rubrivivax sp.]|nr:GspH/FimT family protein [Rubrivivax sp.]
MSRRFLRPLALRCSRRSRGLSLIESLVAAGIAASAAAAVIPGLSTWRAQLSVRHAAAEFETDVYHARSLALTHNETVRLGFDASDAGACWVIHTGPRGGCQCEGTAEARCEGDARLLRHATLAGAKGLRLETNAGTMAFDPGHGTVSPAATVRFSAQGARTVHQVVGIMGRVRSCVPGGGLSGYRSC